MHSIALTGSIGSGKTTVLKFVRSFRVPTIDSDSIVSRLYLDKRIQRKLDKAFGTHQKRELALLVFQSKPKRKKLEAILHPLVWREIKSRLNRLKKQRKPIVFVDIPLLFEAKWQNRFDKVVFVKASKKKCIARLEKRGLARKEALLRWNSQMLPMKKVKLADHVIDNSSSLSKTGKQVRELIEELRQGL